MSKTKPKRKPFTPLTAAEKKAREAAKQKVEAGLKAVESSTYSELKNTAKEINHRMAQADQMDGKADDHRLAAAIKLEEARKLCEKRKVNFKKWCEQNVEKSYETVRRLVAVGGAPNPKLALEDMRAGNKKRNKAMRDRKKAAAKTQALPSPRTTPYSMAETALKAMPDKDQFTFLDSKANKLGFRVVTTDDMKLLAEAKRGTLKTETKQASVKPGTADAVIAAFKSLATATEKLTVVKALVALVGGKFTHDFDTGEDGLEIPATLDVRQPSAAVAAEADKPKRIRRGATA